MFIVADGGSTKTDWVIVSESGQDAISTKGLNPLFVSREEVLETLELSGLTNYKNKIEAVYFYGAGFVSNELKQEFTGVLRTFFGNNANCVVEDDLIAACKALFGNGEGIAVILGTGANTCYYNNGKVEDKTPALGYILGDEGSGADIGIRFINALFKRQLPVALCNKILLEQNIDMMDVIERVYKKEGPNKYLASLTKLLIPYIEYPEIKALVSDAFHDTIHKNIINYNNYRHLRIGFVGSVAFYFQEVLEDVLAKNGLVSELILKSPINNLVDFHKCMKAQ
jgi:N-acetylglucosamine kinase-like BadF-type ATPase